jgi:hypothetical protein
VIQKHKIATAFAETLFGHTQAGGQIRLPHNAILYCFVKEPQNKRRLKLLNTDSTIPILSKVSVHSLET